MIFTTVLASPFIEWIRDAGIVVGFLLSVIGLVVYVVKPVKKLVKDYKEALTKSETQLKEQSDIIKDIIETNRQQSDCIKAIKSDRKSLTDDVKTIKNAVTSLLKVELDRGCIRALSEGHISAMELKSLTDLADIYHKFIQNGKTQMATLDQVRKLPLTNTSNK